MIVSDHFFHDPSGYGINAVSYNLVSGTREALTYDSLLCAGQEELYLKVASRQDFLYEGLFAFTSLMSVVTVSLGYQKGLSPCSAPGNPVHSLCISFERSCCRRKRR